MNLSTPFVRRPVATTLISIGIAIAGILAFPRLPVAPLPQVDFPTILVQAQMPGASPETMASSVAGPLENRLGKIAAVSEMTSQSTLGNSRITLQFNIDRDIDGAARDVQAAINAARADLPASLRSNPTYRKVNPADFPIMVLSLTSSTLTQGQLYDSAANIVQQRLSQIQGIGNVDLGGSALPAVRIELQPSSLYKFGIGFEDVRAAVAAANARSPNGVIEEGSRRYQIEANDRASTSHDYRNLIIAYRNNAAVRLSDVARVTDSVEDIRNLGIADGRPAVIVLLYRQPNANIIETVARVREELPSIQASLPGDVDLTPMIDRTATIKASLAETEKALLLSILLVVLVVLVFLREPRAAMIPATVVPISLLGAVGAMYIFGYSLDNLSFMALIIATGFVVDDAIVVVENVSRHIEKGVPRLEAAIKGAGEVGFTVVSISLSLIAVFVPILFMGGIVGRIFREFAVVLAITILISLVISLTTTPMMCSRLLTSRTDRKPGRLAALSDAVFERIRSGYARTLDVALRHPALVMLSLAAVIGLNAYLYVTIPKGLFPLTDTGRINGTIQGDQSISFQLMSQKLRQFADIVQADPAVAHVAGFTGGRQTNGGFMFIALKPLNERRASVDQVIQRLRAKTSQIAGARLYLQAVQDLTVGGRQSGALYQFTLQSWDAQELQTWAARLVDELQRTNELADINSDQQIAGLSLNVAIDRQTIARFGITPSAIDNTLYDAFGQRQVSTIYNPLNQYHVVMEVAPEYGQGPSALDNVYVSTQPSGASGTQQTNAPFGSVTAPLPPGQSTAAAAAANVARNQASNAIANTGHGSVSSGAAVSTSPEAMVPLTAITRYEPGKTALSINHHGVLPSTTISFNLKPGQALSDATVIMDRAIQRIGMPATVQGTFAGTAATFVQSLKTQPVLILFALIAVYIVLGILYESTIHPLTILSTLPSAGVGAVTALMLTGTQFTVIALIGVMLLIGIVKKNAILMVDFAIQAERQGMETREAIRQACLLRLRPILMTTFAAALGALPLALSFGEGAELRQPLGISIVGGLLASQLLTLYTTPVVYIYLDRFQLWLARKREAPQIRGTPAFPD